MMKIKNRFFDVSLSVQDIVLFSITLLSSIVLEYFVRGYNLWYIYHMDSLMHFMWGINIALFCILFLKWDWKSVLFGIFAWQMFWECIEMIGDLVIVQGNALLDNFYMDGIKDTACDLLGGIAGWFLLRYLSSKRRTLKKSSYNQWILLYFYMMIPGILIGTAWYIQTGVSHNTFAMIWIIAAAVVTWLIYPNATFLKRLRVV